MNLPESAPYFVRMKLSLNEDGPYIDFTTKDGSQASINLRIYAQEHQDEILLRWCEEQLGRPVRRRLQVVGATEQGPES